MPEIMGTQDRGVEVGIDRGELKLLWKVQLASGWEW